MTANLRSIAENVRSPTLLIQGVRRGLGTKRSWLFAIHSDGNNGSRPIEAPLGIAIMTEAKQCDRLDQSRDHDGLATIGLAAGGVTLSILFSQLSDLPFGEAWMRNTAWLALMWYVAALFLLPWISIARWRAIERRQRLARIFWTWGVISFWLHVAVSFHYRHDWSHTHAFEHVQKQSGLGYGIYFSYMFTLGWSIDCIWWWLAPQGYATRSVWFGRLLHVFMLFMAFNATIVFEEGASRILGIASSIALTINFFIARQGLKAISASDAVTN